MSERNIHKGDIVIAENPNSKSNRLVRSYHIVHEVTKAGSVIIKMAADTMVKRQFSGCLYQAATELGGAVSNRL